MGRLESNLHFVRADSGEPAPEVMAGATVLASSRGLGWDGVVAEHGTSDDFTAEGLAFAGHAIGVNLGTDPTHLEVKHAHGYSRVVLPPDGLWITAAGAPFTHRGRGNARWGMIEIARDRARRTLGRDIEPRSAYGVVDTQLAGVVRALLGELHQPDAAAQPIFVDGMATAMTACLARHAGLDAGALAPRGGLGDARLRQVKEAIQDAPAESYTTERLAGLVGLSPAHFARAFKRQTRETPHAFVMRLRVERARDLIALGHAIGDTADKCGFADAAHLTRCFKQRFGTTPGQFARQLRTR